MTTITIAVNHNYVPGDIITLTTVDERLWKWVVAFIFRLPKPIKTSQSLITKTEASCLTIDQLPRIDKWIIILESVIGVSATLLAIELIKLIIE